MEGHSEMGFIGEQFDAGLQGRARDDEYESRSGSDNFDGASGDDQDAADDQPQRKKKYHRHTPHQIQELEAFFKENNHPDEKQRADLSRRLNLENKQVKFWFQNRRTQLKTQVDRQENHLLKQEKERLIAENSMMKEALANPTCGNCGCPAIPGSLSYDNHHLKFENARLTAELNRICALAQKLLGKPLSSLPGSMVLPNPNSDLDLAIGRNGIGGSSNFGMSLPMGLDFGEGVMGTPPPMPGIRSSMGMMMGNEVQPERSMVIDLAIAAMDELIKMAHPDSPLWVNSSDGRKEVLNHEEYARMSSLFVCPAASRYVTEATRETGVVMVNSSSIIEALMNLDPWSEMFASMISRAVTLDVLSCGLGGTRNGALQVMHAEVQLLSPLVPARQMNFLRFCKQLEEGVWAVVDASIDAGRNFKRLPSGCIMQDTPDGPTKITWVEHSQYDESVVHHLYRPMVSSGLGFGAHRWMATLQRQCESLAILLSSSIPTEDPPAISHVGRRSMMKLAQRLANNFFSGICSSSAHKWDTHPLGTLGDDMKMMTRKSMDVPGMPPSIVLCAAASVWMPASQQRLFDFLSDMRLRGKWDPLFGGGPMQEMLRISTGQHGNCVSILCTNAANNDNEGSNRLVFQETWTDSSCSVIVYSPITQPLDVVVNGGDPSYVALNPSGFAIYPDGQSGGDYKPDGANNDGGCLLTVGLQIVPNTLQTAKLTAESVETVHKLISSTMERIKAAL